MDAITLSIITGVLTFGTLMLYILKWDFDRMLRSYGKGKAAMKQKVPPTPPLSGKSGRKHKISNGLLQNGISSQTKRKNQGTQHDCEQEVSLSSRQLLDLLPSMSMTREDIEAAVKILRRKLGQNGLVAMRHQSGVLEKNESSSQALQGLRLQLEDSKLQLVKERQDSERKVSDLQVKVEDQLQQISRYELSSQILSERVEELDASLKLAQSTIEKLQLERQKGEQEVANNEATMRRTLSEMEYELRELEAKLNVSSRNEQLRKEKLEKEIDSVGKREQRLLANMRQLREGLASLLPNLKLNQVVAEAQESAATATISESGEDWIQHYLAAVKQLAKTVDELQEINNNNNSKINIGNYNNLSNQSANSSPTSSPPDSPTKSLADKSTLTTLSSGVYSNRSSMAASSTRSKRVGSPLQVSGRTSKAGSHKPDHGYGPGDKRVMETKLLEALALFCLRCLD